MNYFVVHRQSNLIVRIITTLSKPTSNDELAFYVASEKALDTYFKHLNAKQCQPDIGYMMDKHPYLR